jgi:hypothetical protein
MSSMTAVKARRIGARVEGVANRHADHPAIRAYQATIVPKAKAFILAYDAAAKFSPMRTREFQEGRTAVAQLLAKVRGWAPVVAGAWPGLHEAEFGDNPNIADDVIADASRLLDLVHDAGDAMPFAADLVADLEPALAAAEKEWGEAVAADVTYQALLEAQRDALAVFDSDLQRYRRTLAGVLGRSHKDYQKLRAERAHLPDEDDGPTEPVPVP